jgi:hypothetical protein
MSDRSPFREPLDPINVPDEFQHPDNEDFGDFIKEIASNPNKIIRIEDFKSSNYSPNITREQKFSSLVQAREYFGLLSKRYDIAIPPFQMVIGKSSESKEVCYIVTERVIGAPVMALDEIPEGVAQELDTALEHSYQSWIDAFIEHAPFYEDINPNQFMYGHIAQDPVDRIYFVDIDPAPVIPADHKDYIVAMKKRAKGFLNRILTDTRQHPSLSLPKAKAKLSSLLTLLEEKAPDKV